MSDEAAPFKSKKRSRDEMSSCLSFDSASSPTDTCAGIRLGRRLTPPGGKIGVYVAQTETAGLGLFSAGSHKLRRPTRPNKTLVIGELLGILRQGLAPTRRSNRNPTEYFQINSKKYLQIHPASCLNPINFANCDIGPASKARYNAIFKVTKSNRVMLVLTKCIKQGEEIVATYFNKEYVSAIREDVKRIELEHDHKLVLEASNLEQNKEMNHGRATFMRCTHCEKCFWYPSKRQHFERCGVSTADFSRGIRGVGFPVNTKMFSPSVSVTK
jgi:hypothetical protein